MGFTEVKADTEPPTFELIEIGDGDVSCRVRFPWAIGTLEGDPDTVVAYLVEFVDKLQTHVNDWHAGYVEADPF